MTNSIQTVAFSKGSIPIGNVDHMASLVSVFDLGNAFRFEKGVSSLRMESWLSMHSTKEYINLVSRDLGRPAIVTKKGRGGGTWVHLRVMVDAAMYLDPDLKNEVIRHFVEDRILQIRDDSGDNFIELNAAIALNAEEMLGKPSHRGHYITIAKAIKARVIPDGDDWNTASAMQLSARNRIEERLSSFLKMNLVRDWDHLKELAEKA